MAVPATHADATLREMVQHVLYEVDLLAYWTSAWKTGLAVQAPTGVRTRVVNAVTECALLHLRVIADFLVIPAGKGRRTDLVAEDYFARGWPTRPRYVLADTVAGHKAAKTELDRRLAHLSTHRITDHDWQTFVDQCAPRVLRAFAGFLTDLEAVHPVRARWFTDRIAS